MKLQQLISYLEEMAPPALAEEWDNVGLLCGDVQTEIDTVAVALDVTPESVAFAKAKGAQLIVSHHPVIFAPLRQLTPTMPAYQLASAGIAAYAAHTNLDAAQGGVNDVLARTLELHHVEPVCGGIGRVGYLSVPMTVGAFAAHISHKLHTAVQVHDGDKAVQRVALVSGAGGEYAAQVEADAFVTGEMKHHEWLSLPHGLTAVCAGHYATEAVIVKPLAERIATHFQGLHVLPFVGEAPYETVMCPHA